MHPDKPANQNNPEAREAFERLNEAHRILKDPAKRSDEMNKRLEEAKARRALAEAQATVADRVVINAARTQAVSAVPICPTLQVFLVDAFTWQNRTLVQQFPVWHGCLCRQSN